MKKVGETTNNSTLPGRVGEGLVRQHHYNTLLHMLELHRLLSMDFKLILPGRGRSWGIVLDDPLNGKEVMEKYFKTR